MNRVENTNANCELSESKSEAQKIDRVILEKSSIEILNSMLNQIQECVGDLVTVTQKDLVNFLIQKRKPTLSQQEIKNISEDNYDLIRALKRATSEAIRARQLGNEIKIDEVLKIIQTPSVTGERPAANEFRQSKSFEAEGGSSDLPSSPKRRKRKLNADLDANLETAVSKEKPSENHKFTEQKIN